MESYLTASLPSGINQTGQREFSDQRYAEDDIEDLRCHYDQLRQQYNTQEKELLHLKSSTHGGTPKIVVQDEEAIVNATPDDIGDSTLHSQYLDEINFLQDRVEQLEQENQNILRQQQQIQLQTATTKTNAITTSTIDPEFESIRNNIPIVENDRLVTQLQLRIQELEDEIQQHHHNSNRQQQQSRSLDYSFETEHSVSKQRYNETIDSLQNKESIIQDLQEHIILLEEENYTLNSNKRVHHSVDNEMETCITSKLGLRLPSPDIAAARKEFSFAKKRNSLPPLPSKNLNGEKQPPSVTMKENKRAHSASGI